MFKFIGQLEMILKNQARMEKQMERNHREMMKEASRAVFWAKKAALKDREEL